MIYEQASQESDFETAGGSGGPDEPLLSTFNSQQFHSPQRTSFRCYDGAFGLDRRALGVGFGGLAHFPPNVVEPTTASPPFLAAHEMVTQSLVEWTAPLFRVSRENGGAKE